MRKKFVVAAYSMCILSACQQQNSASTAQTPIFSGVAAIKAATFEVRDFNTHTASESYGDVVTGRGVLYAKDDAIRSGNYMVWISAKESHSSGKDFTDLVDMRDGIGSIETYDYISSAERKVVPEVGYTDWSIKGWLRLNEGFLISEGSQSAVAAAKEQPEAFELRDFVVTGDDSKYVQTYKGRGNLIAKSDAMKIGNYIVWLAAKKAHKNNEKQIVPVHMRDGLGNVETSDTTFRSDGGVAAKYVDWRVFGYSKCSSSQIVLEGKDDQSATEKTPKIELRDFSVEQSRSGSGSGILIKSHIIAAARSETLKSGNYAVWLKAKALHGDDQEKNTFFILREGIGLIQDSSYISDESRKTKRFGFSDWSIPCMIPLNKGAIQFGNSGANQSAPAG
ncbi:hypothetical protein [Azohydromonas australica]|uniref:hypothetical protein n=1 Tax=Azohydromonas australica TaxID=364039 RepID=UPI0012EBDE5D|nr:hypothetical protein [Azohydromonas australica]